MAQAQRTLNIIRSYRIKPKLSADAFLEGQHDYNAVPLPPLGWRMLIFEGPEKRSSWGFHGVEGFSVGLVENNYRCYTGWVPTTGAERILYTVVFFPTRKYTYDLPAPPIQEELVQEEGKSHGRQPQNVGDKQPNIHTFIKLFRTTKNVRYNQLDSKKRLQTESHRKVRGRPHQTFQ